MNPSSSGTACAIKMDNVPQILCRRPLLNLVTHNPIIPLLFLHLLVVFWVDHGLTSSQIHWSPVILGILSYWAALFGWEVSRKVRSAKEEDRYPSYSRILTRPGAILLAGAAQTIALGIGLYLYRTLDLSVLFPTVLLIGYGLAVRGHVRFLHGPSRITSSRLAPTAEQFLLSVLIAHTLEHEVFA